MSDSVFQKRWQKSGYLGNTPIQLNNYRQEETGKLEMQLGDSFTTNVYTMSRQEARALAVTLIEFVDDPEVPVPDAWRGI